MFWFIFKSALINSVCFSSSFTSYAIYMNNIIFNTDLTKAINKEHSKIIIWFFSSSPFPPALNESISFSFLHFACCSRNVEASKHQSHHAISWTWSGFPFFNVVHSISLSHHDIFSLNSLTWILLKNFPLHYSVTLLLEHNSFRLCP